MRTLRRTFWSVVALLSLHCAVAISVRAEDISAAPTAHTNEDIRYLMLQDGGLVEGRITPAADRYIVARLGGQMQVAKSRVTFTCRTLEEAYAHRREQINDQKPEPHLALAEWCLRYGLLDSAEPELAEARRLESDHPRLALLERRLERMRSQPAATPKVTTPSKAHVANANEPAIKSSATIDLPDGVVVRFTRKVQPILVNSCTASACHQPGGRQSFQLDRAILRGEANRRSTMHNLEATLALVDRESPEQSPLLVIGRKKHGGMAGPIFGPRQEQAFKHVTDWVALVAPPAKPVEGEETIEEAPAAVLQAEPRKATSQLSIADTKTVKRDVASNDKRGHRTPVTPKVAASPVKEAVALENEEPRTLRQPHHLLYGGHVEPWRPRDAFDPEIFNRLQRSNPETLQQQAGQAPAEPTPQVQSTADQSR